MAGVKKKVTNLLKNIEDRRKKATFEEILHGLGLRHVGRETARLLADHFGTVDNLLNATLGELIMDSIGDTVATSIYNELHSKTSDISLTIKHLQELGLNFKTAVKKVQAKVKKPKQPREKKQPKPKQQKEKKQPKPKQPKEKKQPKPKQNENKQQKPKQQSDKQPRQQSEKKQTKPKQPTKQLEDKLSKQQPPELLEPSTDRPKRRQSKKQEPNIQEQVAQELKQTLPKQKKTKNKSTGYIRKQHATRTQ